MSDDFYLTLPSHSNRNEFPQNQSNHFKIRLPHPKRLEGSGWIMDWAVTFPSNITKFGRAWYNPKDPDIVLEYGNGVDFMKSVINYFEQRRIDSFGGLTFGAKYITEDGKRTYASTHLRFYASTLLHIYGSTPLRFYTSTVLRFYGSTVLRFYTSTVLRLYASTHLPVLPLRLYASTPLRT